MKILPHLFACFARRCGAGFSVLAVLCLLATPSNAQVVEKWVKRYNGAANGTDRANSIAVDSMGNVAVTGYSYNANGNGDYYTAKYAAADGTLLWEKRYNGPANSADEASSIAVDGAGNVVVTGYSSNANGDYDYYTAKYAAANGTLLWENRYNGPANRNDVARSIAVDSAGNVVVTGYSDDGSGNGDYYTAKYAAANGTLLWEKRYNGPANITDEASSIAVDSAGNVAVTGYSGNASGNRDYYTARYAAADGTLLWEKRYNGPANRDDGANSIAVDSAGNVAVTGFSGTVGGISDYYTAKYAAANGALLWEKRYNGPANSDDRASSIAVDSIGNVAVAGYSYNATGNSDYYTAKYAAANGALLWEKRYNGPANSANSIAHRANSIAVDSMDNVAVTGISYNGSNDDYATVYYAAVPSPLDLTFSSDGLQTTDFGSADDYGGKVAVQSDGKILVAGYSYNGSNYDIALVRYNTNGTLDTTFNGTGRVTTIIGGNDDIGDTVAVQSDGKILVGGYSRNASGKNEFALVRYNTTGSLDTSFNGTGKVTTLINNTHSNGYSIALQSDGKILLAGDVDNVPSNQDFAVVRYKTDGTLDTSFNGTGIVTTAIGSGNDAGRSVAVQSDGKIVVAGYSYNGSSNDVALVRYNTNGTLDMSFHGNGKVITPLGSGEDYGNSVALQSDGKIVVVGQSYDVSKYKFAVVRYDTGGNLDPTFNGTGIVRTGIAEGDDYPNGVAIQADGKILVAGSSFNGSNYDFTLVRYNSDGSLDTTFNGTGTVMTAIGSGNDQAGGIALQSDGRIVLAGYSYNGSNTDFAVARYISDSTTGVPALTAPASSTLTRSPVSVNFTLPETALAGSVTLTFTGSVTRVLTLAASQQTSGAHNFSFNPANPTASAQIVSGTAIPDGTYTVTLSYQDQYANPAATASSTGVVIDTTPPTISPVTIASNNPNPVWARLGNTVTLTLTAIEPIQTPSVTLLGVTAAVANPSGNTWTATATVGAATAQGTAAFSIAASDLAGNPSIVTTATTNGSSVKVDKTAPTLNLPANIVAEATSNAGAAVNYSTSATDNLDPSPIVIALPASGSTFPLGTTTVNVTATDAAGNIASGSFTVTVLMPQEIAVEQPAGTNLVAGSTTIAFGNQSVGTPSPLKTFTVRNTGGLPLNLSSVALIGGNAADFYLDTNGTLSSIPPGGSTTFTVYFGPAIPGPKTTTLRIVSNDADEGTFDIALAGTALSNIAHLSDLLLSTGTLTPAFIGTDLFNYSATVPNATTSITVMPTVADSTATVTVNNFPVPSGTASGPISLNLGSNTITVVASAQDGITTRIYTVTVTRALSGNANLAALNVRESGPSGTPFLLSPSFSPAITSYTVTIPTSVTSLDISAIAEDGPNVLLPTGGFVNYAHGLFGGDVPTSITVLAQDGFTFKTYTVNIQRMTPFQEWAYLLFLPPGQNGPGDDPDGDGLLNLLEWAFGLDPFSGGSGAIAVNGGTIVQRGTPVVWMRNTATGVDHRALFGRRQNYVTAGLTYTVQFSADLLTWESSAATPTVLATDFEMEAVTVPYPFFLNTGLKAQFFRVLVTAP